jgi:predicted NAD/FAD-binding protein
VSVPRRPTAAVVGSGVAGLTAAYLLQRAYDVTLFEGDDRLGGHAHTHDLAGAAGRPVAVDSGFIVHNERTYPHLLRLFRELGIATQPTEMSMSITCEGCGLEYAGARGLSGLFAQPRRAGHLPYLHLLTQVKRFHGAARRLLRHADAAPGDDVDNLTLGTFLAVCGFSGYFVNHFVLPLVSCVWSAGAAVSLDYPAVYLFRFLANHGMLSITGSPKWRTVTGGSATYVEQAAKGLTAVQTGTPIRTLTRHVDGVELVDGDGQRHDHDVVVVATHADQALALLGDPTDDERRVLGTFEYSRNETLLHTDTRVLPAARLARASWNYRLSRCSLLDGPSPDDRVQVSYWMNRLQSLDEPVDYLVTLNPSPLVDPDRVLRRMVYDHPVYTPASVAAQRRLPTLTTGRTAFAGAYHGWGFHEDGCASGARAASALGVRW